MNVIAMAYRGLRSPRLWETMQSLGWHPYMRQTSNAAFRPDGGPWTRARALIEGPCAARVARGIAFKAKKRRIRATIIVIQVKGQSDPRIILTDLDPEDAGASWYALRFWIEVGFKALKSAGWQRRKTRRRDPARVERRWLALSISTLCALAYGSPEEDAEVLNRRLVKGAMWRRVWLLPEPWPPPPDGVAVVCRPKTQIIPL